MMLVIEMLAMRAERERKRERAKEPFFSYSGIPNCRVVVLAGWDVAETRIWK